MRLICPNCKAQYEVDASVIPETGRDVQCSNCGRTWFQKPDGAASAMPAGVGDDSAEWADEAGAEIAAPATGETGVAGHAAAPDQTSADETPAPEPWSEPGQAAAGADVAAPQEPGAEAPKTEAPKTEAHRADVAAPAAEVAEPQPAFAPEPASEPAAAPRRQTLDDAVLNVLREEAAREARARQAEGGRIETQGDLGLTAAIASTLVAARDDDHAARDRAVDEHANRTTRDRVARLNGDADDIDEADEALVARGARRELLPDIEEINSTLRATSDRGNEAAARDAPETLRRRRSGFRLGFSTSLILAVFLLAIYLLAPMIAARAPALEPALTRYVGAVDQARVWLDAKMKSTTESMRGTP